jgi:hypothetical protein
MTAWADDRTEWAGHRRHCLGTGALAPDAASPSHGGRHATRIPERQWKKVKDNPVLAQFFGPPLGSYRPADVPAESARQALRDLKFRFVICRREPHGDSERDGSRRTLSG